MQRFNNAIDLAQAAVDAHKAGAPFAPAGCAGFVNNYTVVEARQGWPTKSHIVGNTIRALSAGEFIHAINTTMNEGHDVEVASAMARGMELNIKIIGEGFEPKAVKAKNHPMSFRQSRSRIQPKSENPLIPADDKPVQEPKPVENLATVRDKPNAIPQVSLSEKAAEIADSLREEGKTPTSVEALSEGAADESDDAVAFDRNYAQSLIKSDKKISICKKNLETYGRTLGVELDRSKKFDAMMQQLEDELDAKSAQED